MMPATARFRRLKETGRPPVRFFVDDRALTALAGDSLLTALRVNGLTLGVNEFTGLPTAGFCLMGVCQGCLVRTADGATLQACLEPVTDGMRLTSAPGGAGL